MGPPSDINISNTRKRDDRGDKNGSFLHGITRDLVNMEEKILKEGGTFDNSIKNLYLKKSSALREIKDHFNRCKKKGQKPAVYYTGHGEIGSGNWCFHDGKITIQEIADLLPGKLKFPVLVTDCCYSGHWANYCLGLKKKGFDCFAACPEYLQAIDIQGQGGAFTSFITGNSNEAPSSFPVFSRGDRNDFPLPDGAEPTYVDLVSAHVKNQNKCLIWQSFCDKSFSGIFARLEGPYYGKSWSMLSSYNELYEYATENWHDIPRQNIYSLACDEKLGFASFFVEEYGDDQTILKGDSIESFSYLAKSIDRYWDKGFLITSCSAKGSNYYVVMTKNAENFERDKFQDYFTRSSWSSVNKEISKRWREDDQIVTGICFNHNVEEYLVVMTESSEGQEIAVFDDFNEPHKLSNYIDEKSSDDMFPSIIFKDPLNALNTLVVMSTDERIIDYEYVNAIEMQ